MGREAFDAAYDAAVAALGGVMRMRRIEPDPLVQPERRYVQVDRQPAWTDALLRPAPQRIAEDQDQGRVRHARVRRRM